MATLQGGIQFTGSVGNVSAYKMHGSDKIIVRRKGGPSKQQIETGENFARTRENNVEMGGRSRAAKWVRHAMGDISKLTDQHLGNALQPLMKAIQLLDETSVRGKRNLHFSKAEHILPGFSVNKRFPVEQLVPTPLQFEVDAASLSAKLVVPSLMPGVNLFLPAYAPVFSFVACLGILPDVLYSEYGYKPDDFHRYERVGAETPWMTTAGGSASQELLLQFPDGITSRGDCSLLLSVGVRLGKPGQNGAIQQHRYAGAGKILALVSPVVETVNADSWNRRTGITGIILP